MGAVISLKDVTVSYQRHPALHHISGSIDQGSMTAILGPNGGGKSTLLKAIKGLVAKDAGTIDHHSIRPADIAYMPQYHQIDFQFPITASELVLLGFWRQAGAFGKIDHDCYHQALSALGEVGLAGFENRRISTLSAGQLQRVLFARVIVQRAEVILLDEPFSAVDTNTTDLLLAMLTRWHKEGRTILAVLHNLEQARQYFPQTILLARECIGWGDTASVLTQKNLGRANGMVTAWDDHAALCDVGEA